MADEVAQQGTQGQEQAQGQQQAAPEQSASATDKVESDGTLLGKDGTEQKTVEKTDDKGSQEQGQKTEKTAGVVPETYTFKVPEGMSVDQALADKVSPVFKELGLTQEAVDKLSAVYAPYVQAQAQAQGDKMRADYSNIVKGWKDETIKMLGSEVDKEMSHASKFITKFSSDAKALRQLFDDTGIGNHPLVVSLFIKAGKMLSQDHLSESGRSTSTPMGGDQEAEKVLYPSMNQ